MHTDPHRNLTLITLKNRPSLSATLAPFPVPRSPFPVPRI